MEDEMLSGVAYHPNFLSREDWESDLLLMKNSGINLIRTCELFNGWDQIERQDGVFDFTIIDDFMNVCQRMGIKVMLGTGTASPPQWLKKIDPDIPIENVHGHHYPSDATYSWACPHNPTFEQYWKRYVSTLVIHYRNHPALYAYQIHNEIGLPFMSQDGTVEVYCYCIHTKKAFQQWVKEKYQTIEALNTSWTWSTSNPYYTSFDDVLPPSHMPKAWSSVTRWLDFRLFMMDSMTSFVAKQHHWIKQYDASHPTCVNTFIMKGEDKLGVLCGIDPFHLSEVVDHIGFDLYPGSGNKEMKYPEISSLFLDFARSSAYAHSGQFWMLETESGPINGWALGPHHNTNEFDICRNVIRNIGHNAKMELYMMFREYPFQPINWGGLVDLQGQKTKRLDMVKQLNKCIQAYHLQSPILMPRPAQVAILISRENAILCTGFGHEAFLVDNMRSHYQLF